MESVVQFIPLFLMIGIGWFFVARARARRQKRATPTQDNENFFSSIHYGVYIAFGVIVAFAGAIIMPDIALDLMRDGWRSGDIRTAREVDRFAPVVAVLGGIICALGVIKAILKK